MGRAPERALKRFFVTCVQSLPAAARPPHRRRAQEWQTTVHAADAAPAGAGRGLNDVGLALDEIAGMLDAPTVADWKAIAAPRRPVPGGYPPYRGAWTYLAGALLCCYDHPATGCQVVGAEINRRLMSS